MPTARPQRLGLIVVGRFKVFGHGLQRLEIFEANQDILEVTILPVDQLKSVAVLALAQRLLGSGRVAFEAETLAAYR